MKVGLLRKTDATRMTAAASTTWCSRDRPARDFHSLVPLDIGAVMSLNEAPFHLPDNSQAASPQ